MYPLYSLDQLETALSDLLASPWVPFNASMRVDLPENGGIYRICDFATQEPRPLYVGLSANLRDRLYGKHFMGNDRTSVLKKKLVRDGLYANAAAVKEYLRNSCKAQFAKVDDARLRCFAEHHAVAALQPPYND